MNASPSPVRVRFAPSPTGRLHVGGARTAIFNWLFARHHGGTLVLRIEDTDQERSTRASESSLLADLEWMGLDWDEGPDGGGPYPPYRQSERQEIYAESASRLAAAGAIYPCFCTDAELDAKRGAQRAAGLEPHYDGTCRGLDPRSAAERRAKGETHTMRFRVPDRSVTFEDRVRGSMRFESSTVGDFVLLRSNGMPTYTFACVVDDAAMRISHVLRGEDHLTNTMRQVLIYEAFGLTPPEFAHLSLIVDADRAKLKKREGQEGTYVDEYRARGYLPGALVNFLALLGWSSPSGDEVLNRQRLVAEFDLDRVGRAPAVFDTQKLRWMAGEHLRAAPLAELARDSMPFMHDAGLDLDMAAATRMLAAFRDGLTTLADLPMRVRDLLHPGAPEPEAAAALQAPEARRLLKALVAGFDDRTAKSSVDGAVFKALLQECGKTAGIKGRELFLPVRAAISGRAHGPEIPLLFDALGADVVRERLAAHAR